MFTAFHIAKNILSRHIIRQDAYAMVPLQTGDWEQQCGNHFCSKIQVCSMQTWMSLRMEFLS